jgi:hypothetical protein
MDEHVLRTVFRLDETETLRRIEKLNRTDGHVASPCQTATSRAPEVTLQGFFRRMSFETPQRAATDRQGQQFCRLSGSIPAEKQSFSGAAPATCGLQWHDGSG